MSKKILFFASFVAAVVSLFAVAGLFIFLVVFGNPHKNSPIRADNLRPEPSASQMLYQQSLDCTGVNAGLLIKDFSLYLPVGFEPVNCTDYGQLYPDSSVYVAAFGDIFTEYFELNHYSEQGKISDELRVQLLKEGSEKQIAKIADAQAELVTTGSITIDGYDFLFVEYSIANVTTEGVNAILRAVAIPSPYNSNGMVYFYIKVAETNFEELQTNVNTSDSNFNTILQSIRIAKP